jgi:hypothetical protein
MVNIARLTLFPLTRPTAENVGDYITKDDGGDNYNSI